jgi:hypothetical protein
MGGAVKTVSAETVQLRRVRIAHGRVEKAEAALLSEMLAARRAGASYRSIARDAGLHHEVCRLMLQRAEAEYREDDLHDRECAR